MSEAVDEAHRLIDELIEREGGFVNHPADRGGPTRFGITEAVARAHGNSGAMAMLPRDEAAAICPRFDEIAKRAPKVATELFDTGANVRRSPSDDPALPQFAGHDRHRRRHALADAVPGQGGRRATLAQAIRPLRATLSRRARLASPDHRQLPSRRRSRAQGRSGARRPSRGEAAHHL